VRGLQPDHTLTRARLWTAHAALPRIWHRRDVVAPPCQHGVATRQQLCAAGLTPAEVDAQVDGGRWRRLNDSVICTHNGPLTVDQARWAVVLSAQSPRALCGLTGLELWCVRGLATSQIHILVRRGGRVMTVPGVDLVVHESRRFSSDDVVDCAGLPTTTLDRCTVDAAVWTPDGRTATRIVVAPVQQRRTNATRLYEECSVPERFVTGAASRCSWRTWPAGPMRCPRWSSCAGAVARRSRNPG
jgi:hypothetical protein